MMPTGEAPRLAALHIGTHRWVQVPQHIRRIQSAAMRSLHLVKRMALDRALALASLRPSRAA
jgi:hypothetical protein